MKYIQALLALVALTSVAASPLPGDDASLAMRAPLPFSDGHALEAREPKKAKTKTAVGLLHSFTQGSN